MPQSKPVVKVAIWAMLEAKPGREQEVADFLESALPLVEAEPATLTWYAVKIGPTTFGIFDTFAGDAGRDAHLSGQVAAALIKKAPDLFVKAPDIRKIDILAAKLSG
ncbi:MAG TPA: antibiotic biosynthesis monooxygenase [Candidatus Saccharimonadales bacterium]|nr:antibiotic biosynthesis monooxygenase [Candidatus Saccharimonadales bacterium]